ncbi:peptidylprolyl isomerase [Mannheimia sp. AT1]|uniref:Peptidylprolyl isomerase n=1 Tax=Mannheimia cairinae TaxID=3025936 RepID=A0ABT5MNM2_9PAST|nr:peptidylprolyl isomerase [Mannheimia cairinae]MDD0823700.1 peptidylprolyl isomerase [Mannheimia cairinae]MDD0825368.1 peptidylprolyl isomerase [Mannheimia cairinae]
MKLVKSLFAVAVATVSLTQTAQAFEERVVALVNDTPVMESQVQRVLGKKKATPSAHKAAVDQVIDDMLVQQVTKEAGVTVSPAAVDQAVEDIAIQNGITYGQLLDALDYQGITLTQFKRNIAHQMAMEQVRHFSIGRSIQVSPEQVQTLAKELMAKDKANGKFKTVLGKEHRVSHILLKTNPILNDNQAKAKLNSLISDIKTGKTTFEKAAEANSVDYASGADGGDLGFNFLEIYDPAFAKVASTAKTGQISAPFKSQFGWHILKVTDIRDGDRTEDAYHQRAYQQLVNKQAEEASKDWIKALRKTVHIQYLGQ